MILPLFDVDMSAMKNIVLATAFALAATHASASCVPIAPGLPGWERLDFKNITPNIWAEDGGAVAVTSNSGASMLYTSTGANGQPVLTWRWRIDNPVPATDLTRKGGDDRSMALTVGFAYDSANASMGERMKRVVVESVAGADAPGRVIEFVWGGNQPQGSRTQSPYSGSSGQIVTLRTSADPAGQWQSESVNVAALYREIWGSEAPPVTRVALTADSDDTKTTSSARISDICFQ